MKRSDFIIEDTEGKPPRWWYWPPWSLTNPFWPPLWRGGDEWGRSTIVIQPPLLGAFIIARGEAEL